MKRLLLSFGLISVAALASIPTVLGSSFMLAPPRIELTTHPGAIENLMLTVLTSAGEGPSETMRLRFYVVDFSVTGDGQVEFDEPGSSKHSASRWLDLEFRDFEMKAGDKKTAKLTVRVPMTSSGGYYAAIVLEELPLAELAKGSRLVHTVRMVTLVELTVKGRGRLLEDASISNVAVGRVGKEAGMGFTVTVENRGNIHIKGKGELVVSAKQGGRVTSLPLEAGRGTILPEGSRDFVAVLDRQLSPGNYNAQAVVKYGMRGQAVATVPFSVSGGRLSATGDLDAERHVKFLVDPYWIEITASPGAFRTVPIVVVNEDDRPVHVTGMPQDVEFDLDGRLVVSDGSNSEWSCAEWIDVDPKEFDLQPRQRRRVIAKVALPEDVSGSRSAQVDFAASLLDVETGTVITSSAGTTVLLTVPGDVELAGDITNLKVVQGTKDRSVNFVALFNNKGNVPVAPKGRLVVRSLGGSGGQSEVMGEVELDEIMGVVLPEGSRRLVTAFPGILPTGKYTAEMTINYGGTNPAEAQREFTVE